jgi:hypothetical protein
MHQLQADSFFYLYGPLASRMVGYIVSFAVITGFSTALWLLAQIGFSQYCFRQVSAPQVGAT